jgi:hypothetical protein
MRYKIKHIYKTQRDRIWNAMVFAVFPPPLRFASWGIFLGAFSGNNRGKGGDRQRDSDSMESLGERLKRFFVRAHEQSKFQ